MLKKLVFPLLLILLLLGCQRMYPDEYFFVTEHAAPFAYRETGTEEPTTEMRSEENMLPLVSRHSDIRDAIQNMVLRGEETGVFLLEGYDSNVDQDMKDMYNEIRENEPKYVYAMDDRFEWKQIKVNGRRAVEITLKLRLTPQEVQMIPTKMYSPAISEIKKALVNGDSSYTVQVSGYQDTDVYALLEQYVLEHPDEVVEAPDISVSVFPPNQGNVRVIEVRFDYHTDKETLRKRLDSACNFLETVNGQLSVEKGADEIVETLYKHLVPVIDYKSSPDATVYSLLVRKTGSSRVMASVVAYLCNRIGAQCEIVVGEREGEPWYWNRILTEAGWRSFDMHASALADAFPVLLRSEEMIGYTWDPITYPEVESEEPTEPTEPTEQTDQTEPTAPTELSEPAAPSEPVEIAESTESTESTQPSEPTEFTESRIGESS